MLLERFCPVPLPQSNKAMEKGVKIPYRNTEAVDVLWGPGSCWCFVSWATLRWENWPQRGMSPWPGRRSHRRGRRGCSVLDLQARALEISLLVLSLPWSCRSRPAPCRHTGQAQEGSTGLLLEGLHRPRVGLQLLLGPAGGRAGPPVWGQASFLQAPQHSSRSLTRGVPTCSFLHHHQGLCCDCNPLPSPAVICLRETSLGFSQDVLQTWGGKQPGALKLPRVRSSSCAASPPAQSPLLRSLHLRVQVAAPCGPSSGSPSTSHTFWLHSSSCLSIFASPIQKSSKLQDLLAGLLLAALSISATRKVKRKRGDAVSAGLANS